MNISTLTNLILIFDVDGVLVKYGEKNVPEGVVRLLKNTPIIKMLASGKPLAWCWAIGEQIRANAIFAENALVYQTSCREAPQVTADISGLERLKEIIKFRVIDEAEFTAEITLDGTTSHILFEPGKTILTFWAEPREKMERFALPHSAWSEEQLLAAMRRIIEENGLNLEVSGPYKDGGSDYIPRGINKGIAADITKKRFPGHQIVVFVDDFNDIPLALRPDVFAITFGNAMPLLRAAVEGKQEIGEGMIFKKAGYDGGLDDALRWLFTDKNTQGGKTK